MANPRVHEVAAELGVDSKLALDKLKSIGEFARSASSSIPPPVARRLRAALQADGYVYTPAPRRQRPPVPEPYPLSAKQSARLLGDLRGLPRMFPEFADVLGTYLEILQSPPGRRYRIPPEALSGWNYYAPLLATGRVDEIPDKGLPSEHGLTVIPSAGGARIVAWATRDRLHLFSCSIHRGPDDVAYVSRRNNSSRQLEDGVYYVDDGHGRDDAAELLARVVASIPIQEEAASRPRRARASGSDTPELDEATRVVYLRRHRSKSGAIETSREAVKRTSRWVVRGHWRNQPFRRLGATRRIWIAEHYAGRADASVEKRDIVYVIRAPEGDPAAA